MDEKDLPIPSEENDFRAGGPVDDPGVPYRATEGRVRVVLLGQLAFCLLGAVVGTVLYVAIAAVAGWDTASLTAALTDENLPANRWQLRTMLALSHLGTFVFAGMATVWLFYRRYVPEARPVAWRTWRDYLGFHRFPRAGTLGLTVLLMMVSVPLVLYTYQLNRALPLPDALRQGAEDTNAALKILLNMESPAELLANLVLIGLLPAVGEELIFRGVVQRQLMRRIAEPWLALVVGAALFSFIHFQFDGFLPRLVLGLLLGWLYWRTHNLWVPMVAHFFNNGAQVVGQYLYRRDISSVDLEQDIELPWYMALISLALVLWVMWRIEKGRTV